MKGLDCPPRKQQPAKSNKPGCGTRLASCLALIVGVLVLVGLISALGNYLESEMTDEERAARIEQLTQEKIRDNKERVAKAVEKKRKEREKAEKKWEEEAEAMALVMCQQFVEDRLVAPRSAKWPWLDSPAVSRVKDKRYRVQTYVDSHNKFGAMIRTQVDCLVEYRGDDQWKLVDLKLDD